MLNSTSRKKFVVLIHVCKNHPSIFTHTWGSDSIHVLLHIVLMFLYHVSVVMCYVYGHEFEVLLETRKQSIPFWEVDFLITWSLTVNTCIVKKVSKVCTLTLVSICFGAVTKHVLKCSTKSTPELPTSTILAYMYFVRF